VSRIDLGIVTQKEAITFYDDNTLIFTDEEFKGRCGVHLNIINRPQTLFFIKLNA